MSQSISVVLLATAGPLRGNAPATALAQVHRAKLKAALELPGAAIAVTGNGEYLGIYEQPGIAMEAALAFQHAADLLGETGSTLALTGRVVLDVWPANAESMPVERVREIMSYAREHSVLLTPEFAATQSPALRAELVSLSGTDAAPALRGVVEMIWRESATTFRESTRQVSMPKPGQLYGAVLLMRRDKEVLVRPAECPFTVGRDASCSLTVGGTTVSRFHGEISFESGKFYFRDESRNGTFLTTGGEEMFLQGERFPLVSKGVISPGAPLIQQTGDVIKYSCLAHDTAEE